MMSVATIALFAAASAPFAPAAEVPVVAALAFRPVSAVGRSRSRSPPTSPVATLRAVAAPSAVDRRLTDASATEPGGRRPSLAESYLHPSPGSVLLIDAENLRGKSGFEMSHPELLHRTSLWADRNGIRGHVSLVVDHGAGRGAYWLPRRGVGVVFAGPCVKADDVLAREAVPFFLELALGEDIEGETAGEGSRTGRDVVVCTSDGELCHRCRSVSVRDGGGAKGKPGGTVRIMPPARLLEELELLNMDEGTVGADGNATRGESSSRLNLAAAEDILGETPEVAELKAEIVRVEGSMRRQRLPKKRRRHLKQLRVLRERLGALRYSDVAPVDPVAHESDYATMTRDEHCAALLRWNLCRDRSGRKRKESTSDREFLAEELRKDLERISMAASKEESAQLSAETMMSPVELHVLSVSTR